MAAIPVTRTPIAPRTPSRTGERVLPRARPAARQRARSRSASLVLGRIMAFTLIAAVTYLASSMGGQVMVEKARREGIAAQRRAVEAKRAEAGLRSRVNELTGFTNMETWATAHGYVASELPVPPSREVTRVAKLD